MRCLISFLLLVASACLAQDYGSISGTVVDERGAPVADATVTALQQGYFVMSSAIPQVSTRADGTYVITHLQFGRYQVTASKPQEDYPPLHLPFYGGFAKQPEVEISSENSHISLDLTLASKAGVLVGTVSDAESGTPLNANVDFHCPEAPARDLSGGGLTNARFRVLVPTDTPVIMRISQKGYEDWWFTRDGVVTPMRLSPGETLQLEIKLKRADSRGPINP